MAASVETMLDLWSLTLREGKARLCPLSGHPSMAESAAAFLDSLVGPEHRKMGWRRAEAAGDAGPWRQQAVLGRSHWNADPLRDVVREYMVETLGSPEAVLVINETGFLKQGKASCGVARQYTGSAGKITNCQIGVLAVYVLNHGHALIHRQLYLPKDWATDRRRRAGAHVPEEVAFATKPARAAGMIDRAAAAHVPFAWVSGDSVYGVGEIEWAESERDYVHIYNYERAYLLRTTLSALHERLGHDRYVRVRRSVIVRLDCISAIRDRGYGDIQVLLQSGQVVQVGRTYLKALRQRLKSWGMTEGTGDLPLDAAPDENCLG